MRTTLRSAIITAVLGAATASFVAALVLPAGAQSAPDTVAIDNFTFNPQRLSVKAGTTVTWTTKDDSPACDRRGERAIQIESSRHRRRLFIACSPRRALTIISARFTRT